MIKLGYKSSYIGACLEQYESAYGYKRYDFEEIKSMIDRMAKPDQPANYNYNNAEAESKTHSSATAFGEVYRAGDRRGSDGKKRG